MTELFDTLIVGAGSAGAVLAARLSEDPGRTVCVVEAGPDYATVDELPDRVRTLQVLGRPFGGAPIRSHEWGYTGRGSAVFDGMLVPRGRVVGGSSSINGTVLLRALRADLDSWAAMGNDGWDYAACEPYFRKLEADRDFPDALHGSDGPIPVTRAARADWVPVSQAFHEACTELGFADCPDMNRADARGVGPIPCNFEAGVRHSTAIGYLMPARTRPNLRILSDALVTRLRFDGLRARGIDVVRDGEQHTLEANEVILSAGGIGSPHLLMLSGVGPADQLRALGITPLADLPGVGQHVRDHPFVATVWAWQDGVATPDPPSGLGWQLQLRTSVPGSTREDDAWITMITRTGPPRWQRGFSMPCSLMYATSQGAVTLRTADPLEAPSIDFNYCSDPGDTERLSAIARLAVEIGSHAAFDRLRLELVEPAADVLADPRAMEQWVLRTASTGHHISCTCRMGAASDPLAVVDSGGRVYGVEGLRVIDASIMPDCPRVNLNATVIMLAEKLADALRGA